MGYNTEYKGKLNFTCGPTTYMLNALEDILGQDCREHKWRLYSKPDKELTFIDLELNEEKDALIWNESEKSYDMADKIELVVQLMQDNGFDFGLYGEFECQGEDMDDRYFIVVEDNEAKEVKGEDYYLKKAFKFLNKNDISNQTE